MFLCSILFRCVFFFFFCIFFIVSLCVMRARVMAASFVFLPACSLIWKNIIFFFIYYWCIWCLLNVFRATLGQGIRSGCGIVPITGPGGLQHYGTADRRSSSSLRVSLSFDFNLLFLLFIVFLSQNYTV